MDALILDLRNNPGGLLDTAVDVSERFLPKDAVIVSIKSRDKDQDVTFKSGGRFAFHVSARFAESSSTVKLPPGIDETAAMMVKGLYVPSSTSTFIGTARSSTTDLTLTCALILEPRITAAVDIQNARYRSTILKNVHAAVRREDGAYQIDLSTFEALGGHSLLAELGEDGPHLLGAADHADGGGR